MSLRVYNRKRKFNQTPEPKGKKAAVKKKGDLRFVVQMHEASRLHFDFRLEFDGALKSWAVPKGPSLNPLDQRLAVFVEDHPIAYGSFEGIIPKGNYGAGNVMVWDEGTYQERSSENRRQSEAAMKRGFSKGHLTFVLSGQKLKGEFALIQLKKDAAQKSWLLVKKRDAYSTYKRSEIPHNRSVKTGRTMSEIQQAADEVWLPKKGKRPAPLKKSEPTRKDPLPRKNKPMQPTPARKLPAQNWIQDPLLKGIRALAEVEKQRVSLYSRSGLSFDKRFPAIAKDLKKLSVTAVFDGEIVDNTYFIYDVLYWENRDLRDLPLKERRRVLHKAKLKQSHVQLITAARASDKELVFKNPDSPYKGGPTADWQVYSQAKSVRKSAIPLSEDPRLTNLDKVYFPKDGITKGDVIDYYRAVAPYILPYLHDRPESLNRQPNGIARPGFYQKDMTGHIPRWLKTERIFSESADKSIDYVLCQDERSLLYLANLGCIELHPWFSRIGKLDHPDFLVIDLDPDGNPFPHVCKIALTIHQLLDEVGAANFVKTSGATGLHIGVPTAQRYDFDTARSFAEKLCHYVARKNPALTSVERNPSRRRKKIYLDFMQNRRGQTLAAPFCIRPHPGAPVSMPITWKEVTSSLKPEQFNMQNALARISKFKDPWRPVLGPGVDLDRCTRKLARIIEEG